MERGTVTHVGTNSQGNKYGFARTPSGVDVYFNQFGGYYSLVVTDAEVRFPVSWHEVQSSPRERSPFPEIGDEVAFVRATVAANTPAPKSPSARMWCLSRLVPEIPVPV